jgi:hypothetical protein
MDHHNHEREKKGFFDSRANVVLIAFLAIGAFYLIAEHRAHLLPYLGYWPYLLVLACPLLHVFMHSGHGGHGGNDEPERKPSDASKNAPHQH